jgi:hypothetical protein
MRTYHSHNATDRSSCGPDGSSRTDAMRTAEPMLEETVLMQIRENIAREDNKLNEKLARS